MTADPDRLGPPISEEQTRGDWSYRHYERGSICTHPKLGVKVIEEPFRSRWMNMIYQRGFPLSDVEETELGGRKMWVMKFEQGQIFRDVAAVSAGSDLLFDVAEPNIDGLMKAVALAIYGRWEAPFEEGSVAIHMALLHTNEVLAWTYHDPLPPGSNDHLGDPHGLMPDGEWSLLDLTTGKQVVSRQLIKERNQFCAGQCILGDGKVLVVGGDRYKPELSVNDNTVQLYDPRNRQWMPRKNLEKGRYYPTVITIDVSYSLIVAGEDVGKGVNASAQILYESGDAGAEYPFDAGLRNPQGGTTYPFASVLPKKRLFVHLGQHTRLLDLNIPNDALNFDGADKFVDGAGSRTYGLEGTAVLLPLRPGDGYRAEVMLIGGGNGGGQTPAKDSCVRVDLDSEPLAWTDAAPMKNKRVMPDAVLLPDGNVLVVNGSATGGAGGDHSATPVFEAELYDPRGGDDNKGTWTTLAPATMSRLYHATALLLPDARVLTGGTDREWNDQHSGEDYAHTKLEAYSPPYLFWGARPSLRYAPESIGYSELFEVAIGSGESIKTAVLIRNGSCTHSFNSDQRFVELNIVKPIGPKAWTIMGEGNIPWPGFTGAGVSGSLAEFPPEGLTVPIVLEQFVAPGLVLQAPPDRFIAPPGYYMLFLVSDQGVPSAARFVRLG